MLWQGRRESENVEDARGSGGGGRIVLGGGIGTVILVVLYLLLGGDPLLVDGGTLISSSASTTGGLTLSFMREEASLGNVTLTLEWNTDLGGTWTSVPITQTGGAQANGVNVTVNQTSTPDEITVNIPASNAVNGHLFARLRASMP